MLGQENQKLLALSGERKLKHCENISNDVLINTPLVNSSDNEDKNILRSVNDPKHIMNNQEKVRKLIETIKIKQDHTKSHSSRLSLSEPNMQISSNHDGLRVGSTDTSFKNRFQAQKNIIERQQIKLQEKEKIINQLKMGIITEEVRDCQNKTKIEIRELFQDFNLKLIGKVPMDYIPTNKHKLWIKTQNAPKIIQELEQRAFERMKYREMIKERKRNLDETRKKMQEEILEQKRCLEAEEKKKQLEIMKEKRHEELIKMKTRQMNKEKFLNNLEKAIKQFEMKLLKNTFSKWKLEYKCSLDKKAESEYHYRKCIMRKSFRRLLDIVELKYALKYKLAYKFHKRLTLKRTFRNLHEHYMDRIRSMQVAEDFYDFTLQYNIVRHWYGYISKEKILTDIKMQQAIHHYKKTLLFQSFFQWKSLPTVLKLEKAKEERKQKWRQKVWEILPDFSPSEI